MKIQEINLGEIRYPYLLSQIHNPPKKIYVLGNKEILREKSIAIVGCRECTEYGKKVSMELAYNLGIQNIITVSGLAKGIDAYCHIGTIKRRLLAPPYMRIWACLRSVYGIGKMAASASSQRNDACLRTSVADTVTLFMPI